MSWKDKWSHRDYKRPKRPARRKLTTEGRDALLGKLRKALAGTAVLPALGVRVVAERGFFHFDRPAPEDPDCWLGMGRALPLEGSDTLILEAESSRGGYFEVARGGVAAIVRALADGASGTFHGVGPIEKRARKTKRGIAREQVRRTDSGFVYADDGVPASVQEVLYHHFELPLEAIAEPRDWYEYHRAPELREAARDRVLVEFSASSFSGRSFGGTCLYAKRDGVWRAYQVRPNASDSIATAETWLVKRGWEPWR